MTIGNNVDTIGENAFRECKMDSLVIPSNVECIEGCAFMNCSALKSITICNKISLNGWVFATCGSLEEIIFLNETPPLKCNTTTFYGTGNCPIYVPCGSKNQYIYWAVYTVNIESSRIQYLEKCYTVSFVDWDGAELKTEHVEEGQSATAPANPTREGYTFTGWDKDFTNVHSDLIVTAQYTQNTPGITYYTVTFKDWDGTTLKTQQVKEGESATAPANPTREGYTFTGWDKDFSNVQSDLTVTALYEEDETPAEAITVRLKESNWSKVNLYYWGDGISAPAWPGTSLSKDAKGWYSYTFDASVQSVNIIWNDGSNQTVDITNVTETTCYRLNSTSGKNITVSMEECEDEVIAVTGVSLNKSNLSLKVGESETLTATVTPSNATNKKVTWSSSKTSVATVSANGVVEGIAVGNTTITCTTEDGGFKATCQVSVSALPAEEYETMYLLGNIASGDWSVALEMDKVGTNNFQVVETLTQPGDNILRAGT